MKLQRVLQTVLCQDSSYPSIHPDKDLQTSHSYCHRLTMNILDIAPLLCVVCYVFASETGWGVSRMTGKGSSIEDNHDARRFKDAIEENKVEIANDIFGEGNNEQRKYYGKYLVSFGGKRLAELINHSE